MTRVTRDMAVASDALADRWVASEKCADGTQVLSYFPRYSDAQSFKRGSGAKLIEPCLGNIARSRRAARDLKGSVLARLLSLMGRVKNG